MRLSGKDKALVCLYELGWLAALPWRALRDGKGPRFRERLAPDDWGQAKGWQDIWIEASSVLEARQALALCDGLGAGSPLNALMTSADEAAFAVLRQAVAASAAAESGTRLYAARTPFDSPRLMRKALFGTLPKAVALLGARAHPGLLLACAQEEVPVVLVNARLSRSDLALRLTLGTFFRAAAPKAILAASEPDARRLALLYGQGPGLAAGGDSLGVMPDLRYDQYAPLLFPEAAPEPSLADNPLSAALKPGAAFVVFLAVAPEEEADVRRILAALLAERPKTIFGVFPRDPDRAERLSLDLRQAGFLAASRSRLKGPAVHGMAICFDAPGEESLALALARAAFVGSSLVPAGSGAQSRGQSGNTAPGLDKDPDLTRSFLLPGGHGLCPCVGPHAEALSWLGPEFLKQGLAHEARSPEAVVKRLLQDMHRQPARDKFKARLRAFFDERRGGAAMARSVLSRFFPGGGAS